MIYIIMCKSKVMGESMSHHFDNKGDAVKKLSALNESPMYGNEYSLKSYSLSDIEYGKLIEVKV